MHAARILLIGIFLIGTAAAATAPDPLVLFAVFAALGIGAFLLWPVRDAPVMLVAFGQQWLSVALKPIETALTHRPLDDLTDFGAALTPAVYFGAVALIFLAIGMRAGLGRTKIDWTKTLSLDAERWTQGDLIKCSLILLIGGHILETLSSYVGPARQAMGAFGGARQAGLFMLSYWCLLNNRGLFVLLAVMLIEIALGLSGFFAGFRSTLIVFLVAAVAARPKVSAPSIIGVAIAIGAMVWISIFWSGIKPEYRDFLNEGTGQQVAAKTMTERAAFVIDAAQHFDQDKRDFGVAALVGRTSYVDFLSKVLEYVPTYHPYTLGKQTGGALLHIVTPRLLFPNKPPTPSDTEVTAEYTGMRMTSDPGASISIGYLGELYADFGYFGGLGGTFIIGLLGGYLMKVLRDDLSTSTILNYGLAVTMILQFSLFETALIKFLGGAITAFLGMLVLQRVIVPRMMPSARRAVLRTVSA